MPRVLPEQIVKVNWSLLEPDLKATKLSLSAISELMGKHKSYLGKVKAGSVTGINIESYNILCKDILNVSPDKYKIVDSEETVLPATEKTVTQQAKDNLDICIGRSEEFKKALQHLTAEPVTKPDPMDVTTSNWKYLRNLEIETNQLITRGILKDVNAGTAYVYYKLKHSFLKANLSEISVEALAKDESIKIFYKTEEKTRRTSKWA